MCIRDSYYLRGRVGKRARVRERRYTGPEEIVETGLLHDSAAEAAADTQSTSSTGTTAGALETQSTSSTGTGEAGAADGAAEETEATVAAAPDDAK